MSRPREPGKRRRRIQRPGPATDVANRQLLEMQRKRAGGRPAAVGDLLDGYTPERAWDEMFAGPDEPRSHYQSLHQVLGTLSRDDFEVRCAARDRAFHDQGITFSHSGEERPFPLDLVPAHHRRRRMGGGRGRCPPTGPHPRAVPRRRLRPRRDPRRRCRAPPSGRELLALPPLRRRARSRRWGARPRRRRRPRPRRCRRVPRARGQPADALGDLLRHREPPRDDPRVPRALRQPPHPPGRRLPATVVGGVPRHRAAGGRRSVCRRAHARDPQRRVLRALVPGAPDGCGAGGGTRPRVP